MSEKATFYRAIIQSALEYSYKTGDMDGAIQAIKVLLDHLPGLDGMLFQGLWKTRVAVKTPTRSRPSKQGKKSSEVIQNMSGSVVYWENVLEALWAQAFLTADGELQADPTNEKAATARLMVDALFLGLDPETREVAALARAAWWRRNGLIRSGFDGDRLV
jgi:hypothetical protein